MSRRAAVLEGYRVPDLTNPINPLDAQRMVSQERMHGKELQQQQEHRKGKQAEDRDKELNDPYKLNSASSGTIYDPTGLKATQDLSMEMSEYAKVNPNASAAEIKMAFAPKANKIAMYYEKAKTIKENNKIALEGLQKLGGYNLSEIDLLAQKEALIDPETGQIRDDIDMVDVTQPYWKMAIEKNPLQTTTNEGLHEYVTKAETTPSRVKVKRVDKNKGMVTDELELSVPSFIQVEKDAKGNPIISETGTYGLEPKFETLPNGTKILDEGVFKDLKNNKPSAYQRLMGEVAHYIKTNNDESDDNIAPDSVEAQNIARMLAYKDIKQVWGNKGVKKYDAVVQPPAPRITINNGGGKGTGAVTINDVYQKIVDATKEGDMQFKETGKVGTRMNSLDVDAQKVIFDYIGDSDLDERNTFIVNDDGKIKVYRTPDEGDPVIDDKFLVTTLPRVGTNLKVQPSVKEKKEVVKQGEKPKQSKSISATTIKSLIGKKGYEGYTEKELIEYYKSNGYEIK